MLYGPFDFFTDPLLRAPTLGSILMCASAAIVGVIVFVRKKSLVGEVLSHAAYPGLFFGALSSLFLKDLAPGPFLLFACAGAFAADWFALFFLDLLQRRFRVKSDAAFCFVLSSFFGVGVLLAGRMQNVNPLQYGLVQTFLYGQSATMTDLYIGIYGLLFAGVVGFVTFRYRTIRLVYFDPVLAQTLGFSVRSFERIFSFLLTLAVIVGMKSVGVVLLSGMLVAPALGSRKIGRGLAEMFWIAGSVGAVAAFLGNYFSVLLSERFFDSGLVFPTGPMIVLLSSFFCFCTFLLPRSRPRGGL